jgi:hypothetical protein
LFLKIIIFHFEPTLNQQMPVLNQQIIVFLAGGPIAILKGGLVSKSKNVSRQLAACFAESKIRLV